MQPRLSVNDLISLALVSRHGTWTKALAEEFTAQGIFGTSLTPLIPRQSASAESPTGAPSLLRSLPVSNAVCRLHRALLNIDESLVMQLAFSALKATKSGKADLREAGSANSGANASHASHAAHCNQQALYLQIGRATRLCSRTRRRGFASVLLLLMML